MYGIIQYQSILGYEKPMVYAVSFNFSCGSDACCITSGKNEKNPAITRKIIFIFSSIPNSKISSGEKHVTGMKRIEFTTGNKSLFIFEFHAISIPSGVDIIAAIATPNVTLPNDAPRCFQKAPVLNMSKITLKVDSGLGTNSALLTIRLITCQTSTMMVIHNTFLMIFILSPINSLICKYGLAKLANPYV